MRAKDLLLLLVIIPFSLQFKESSYLPSRLHPTSFQTFINPLSQALPVVNVESQHSKMSQDLLLHFHLRKKMALKIQLAPPCTQIHAEIEKDANFLNTSDSLRIVNSIGSLPLLALPSPSRV